MQREKSPTSLCHISFVKKLYWACCVCVYVSVNCSEIHISVLGTAVDVVLGDMQHDVMLHVVVKKNNYI